MGKVYRKRLHQLGLTYPQYLVLLVLWEQDALTVSGIGDRLFLDSATLTPMLKRMEALQLISRERALDDERQVIVALTPLGDTLREQAKTLSAAAFCATKCSAVEVRALNQQLINLRAGLLQNA